LQEFQDKITKFNHSQSHYNHTKHWLQKNSILHTINLNKKYQCKMICFPTENLWKKWKMFFLNSKGEMKGAFNKMGVKNMQVMGKLWCILIDCDNNGFFQFSLKFPTGKLIYFIGNLWMRETRFFFKLMKIFKFSDVIRTLVNILEISKCIQNHFN
jgi:hypothetical protein